MQHRACAGFSHLQQQHARAACGTRDICTATARALRLGLRRPPIVGIIVPTRHGTLQERRELELVQPERRQELKAF